MLRKTGLSIGIDPPLIRQELYQQLDTLQWRVDHMDVHGLSPEAVAMRPSSDVASFRVTSGRPVRTR